MPTPKLTPNLKKVFAKNSNKKLLKNALMVCLAGESNKQEREAVLKVLEETDYTYYLVMFRGNLGRQDYRALYGHDGG
jgi:type IV secretory pathway TraG/TraD family ATPase VirD4